MKLLVILLTTFRKIVEWYCDVGHERFLPHPLHFLLSVSSTFCQNYIYWTVRGSNPGRGKRFSSLLQTIQTGYGAHPTSYSMGRDVLSGG
jgi:hypothetical protein